MSFEESMSLIGMNLEEVLARFSGSRRLVERFVNKFPADKTYEELKQAMDEKDYEKIERAAHTLKGVCANLGFSSLQEKSAQMVMAVRQGRHDGLDMMFAQVTEDYNKIVDAIRQIQ